MKTLLISLLLLIFCPVQKKEPVKSQPSWKLVWSDEFDYKGLPDSTKWGYDVGYIANNELQYYMKGRLENSRVADGKLMIIGRKEKYKDMDYTSARLKTDGKFSWTYGKVEARMKLPVGQGIWPAFWMLGQNIHTENWPACGEIDIMEHINNENLLHGTLHWQNKTHVQAGGTTVCDVTKYHNYSIEWDKNSIGLFLDGKKYYEVDIKDNVNNTESFHKPQFILLNLAIGGDWPKNPDMTTVFPDTMFVDYVRVYRQE